MSAETPERHQVVEELRVRSTRANVVELEGHHRGEKMTLGQRIWYGVLWWV